MSGPLLKCRSPPSTVSGFPALATLLKSPGVLYAPQLLLLFPLLRRFACGLMSSSTNTTTLADFVSDRPSAMPKRACHSGDKPAGMKTGCVLPDESSKTGWCSHRYSVRGYPPSIMCVFFTARIGSRSVGTGSVHMASDGLASTCWCSFNAVGCR